MKNLLLLALAVCIAPTLYGASASYEAPYKRKLEVIWDNDENILEGGMVIVPHPTADPELGHILISHFPAGNNHAEMHQRVAAAIAELKRTAQDIYETKKAAGSA